MNSTKTISFFISSTFCDMHFERDYIKTVIFPELNEEYNKKNIYIQLIDLRTGIYPDSPEDEVKATTHILKVCKEEIKRSKPYFIGILGNRYGSIPQQEAYTIFCNSLEDDIKNELGDISTRSITEIELIIRLYGAENLDRCLFYFRSEDSYSGMSEDEIGKFYENKDKQDDLKKWIITTAESNKLDICHDYTLTWDKDKFCDPNNAWRTDLKQTIRSLIEKEVNESQENNSIFNEDRQHITAFSVGCLTRHTERPFEEQFFNKALNTSPHIHIITGDSGVGKSTTMCKLHERISSATDGVDRLILFHTAGTHPHSDDIYRVLRRWSEELSKELKEPSVLSLPDNDIADQFQILVDQCIDKGKHIVMIIDALDRMKMCPLLKTLSFINDQKVQAFISTTNTTELHLSISRQVIIEEIPDFTAKETDKFLGKLPKSTYNVLMSKTYADGRHAYSSPLWVGLALFVLNSLDIEDFTRIMNDKSECQGGKKLENYLLDIAYKMPADPGEMFLFLKEFLSDGFENDFLELLFNYLAISQNGVRECDLMALMGTKWNDLDFATIRRYLSFAFFESGLDKRWQLSHNKFTTALKQNINDNDMNQYHNQIADHLSGLDPMDSLRITSGFHHLVEAKRYDDAFSLIMELPYIEAKISYGYFSELLQEYQTIAKLLPEEHEEEQQLLTATYHSLSSNYEFIRDHMEKYPQSIFQVLINAPGIRALKPNVYTTAWKKWNEIQKRPWIEFQDLSEPLLKEIPFKDISNVFDFSISPNGRFIAYYSIQKPWKTESYALKEYYPIRIFDTANNTHFSISFPEELIIQKNPPKDIIAPEQYSYLYDKYQDYLKEKEQEENEDAHRPLVFSGKQKTQDDIRKAMSERRNNNRFNYKFIGNGWQDSFRIGGIIDVIWLTDDIIIASLQGNRIWGWDISTGKFIINIQFGNISSTGIKRWSEGFLKASIERIDDCSFVSVDGLNNLYTFEYDGKHIHNKFIAGFDRAVTIIKKIDKDLILLGFKDGSVRLYDIRAQVELKDLIYEERKIPYHPSHISLSHNKQYVAISYFNLGCVIWDIQKGCVIKAIENPHAFPNNVGTAWSKDDMFVMVNYTNNPEHSILKIDLKGDIEENIFISPYHNWALKEYKDSEYIFIRRNSLCCIKADSYTHIASNKLIMAYNDVQYGNHIITANCDGLYLWDSNTCSLLHETRIKWSNRPDNVTIAIRVSPNGKRVLVIANKNHLYMFDTQDLTLLWDRVGEVAERADFSNDSHLFMLDDGRAPNCFGVDPGKGMRLFYSDTGDLYYESVESHGLDAADILMEYNKEHRPVTYPQPVKPEFHCTLYNRTDNGLLKIKTCDGKEYHLYSHIRLLKSYKTLNGLCFLTDKDFKPIKCVLHEYK